MDIDTLRNRLWSNDLTDDEIVAIRKALDGLKFLRADRARIAAALGAYPDSDLVSLATTLRTFSETHEATTEALRLALQELVYLHDETPDDYADRIVQAWEAARSALAAAPVGRYTRKERV